MRNYRDYTWRNTMERRYEFSERELVEKHTKDLSMKAAKFHVIFEADLTIRVVVRCRFNSPVYKFCKSLNYIWKEI